jgi:uncharacterized membrane protein
MPKLSPAVAVAAVVGLVAILAAYVVLVALGHGAEANGIVPVVVTLLGFLGLGAHNSARLAQQDEQLTKISHQTNGVLTARIEAGADTALRRVLRETGYPVPDRTEPLDPEVTAP